MVNQGPSLPNAEGIQLFVSCNSRIGILHGFTKFSFDIELGDHSPYIAEKREYCNQVVHVSLVMDLTGD